jgi:predicted DNA-binding WGR domain protein
MPERNLSRVWRNRRVPAGTAPGTQKELHRNWGRVEFRGKRDARLHARQTTLL